MTSLRRRLDGARSVEERAALARSLGLVARYLAKRPVRNVTIPLDETAYFEQSRQAVETAETYLCLAETLAQQGDVVSARRFLARALILMPLHPRGHALGATLSQPAVPVG